MTDWMPNVANLPMDIVKDGIDWSPLPEERPAKEQGTIPSEGMRVARVNRRPRRKRLSQGRAIRKLLAVR